MSYDDPWDTRGNDEREGVVWPAPGPITPEMEKFCQEAMQQMGSALGAVAEKIRLEVLGVLK